MKKGGRFDSFRKVLLMANKPGVEKAASYVSRSLPFSTASLATTSLAITTNTPQQEGGETRVKYPEPQKVRRSYSPSTRPHRQEQEKGALSRKPTQRTTMGRSLSRRALRSLSPIRRHPTAA